MMTLLYALNVLEWNFEQLSTTWTNTFNGFSNASNGKLYFLTVLLKASMLSLVVLTLS